MPYNNIIARADVQAMIPEVVSREINESAVEQSAALSLFRRVPMSSNQTRMPVLSALPTAYWVNGDTGLKQTTEMAWANKYLNVEEIAAIVPIPEAVLDDAGFDVWGAVRPRLAEAIARALDAAIFFGTNVPASWALTGGIVAGADAAGNEVFRGTATQAQGGLAEDLNDLFALVEADGFDVNGFVANRTLRGLLRGARDTSGQRIADLSDTNVLGTTPTYAMRGLWPTGLSAAEAIAGDFTMGMIGVRQDITYKILTEGVIQDGTGAIQYNLPQQDMVALRVVARYAFAVANPLNWDQPTEANRYPFGVLRSPAA